MALGDKGLGVFAFAAYHQLTFGTPVKQVTRKDNQGHEADPEAVKEVEEAGLATADEQWITFTDKGLEKLEAVLAAMHQAA